jgi:hypothetical protein
LMYLICSLNTTFQFWQPYSISAGLNSPNDSLPALHWHAWFKFQLREQQPWLSPVLEWFLPHTFLTTSHLINNVHCI